MRWDYWRLIVLLSLAGFFGLIIGYMAVTLFVVTLIYLLWLQRQWFLLHDWLEKPKKKRSPQAEGIIDDTCRLIDQLRVKNANRKKKLAAYLKRFKSAAAALPDGIIVLGEYGQVDWANESARMLLGVHWPRDNNLRVRNLIRDPAFHKLLESPEQQREHIIMVSPEDQLIQLEIKIVDYGNKSRLLIARDITQTMKLQRMRRDFVANVSHELRTPLTVLKGYLETFNDDSSPEMWQYALPVMRQQTERMNLLVKDLLILSQLETGEKPLNLHAVHVGDLLESIIEDAKRLEHYQQQPIFLSCESEKGLKADFEELRSALSNILFNAVKYTPAETRIEVTWSVQSNKAEIIIKDEGDGIAAHHLPRLTERFYRVDSGRARESGGTGLGLAIVKHILQRHHATLDVVSDVGMGAAFICRFPLSQVVDLSEARSE